MTHGASLPRPVALAIGCLVVLALAAAPAGATAPSSAPKPWTASVCSTLSSWLKAIDAQAAKTKPGSSPKASKKALLALMKVSEASTKAAVKKLKKAGAPSGAASGQQIPLTLNGAFDQVNETISGTRKAIAATPITDAASFGAAARHAQDALEASFESVEKGLGAARALDDPALLKPFAANKACAGIAGADDGGLMLSPTSGPPGTIVAIQPAGVDATAQQQCRGSSAYGSELIGADGAQAATGLESVEVPANAAPGTAFVRLVCYLPDATGRRVIHGLCASFTIEGGTPAAAPSTKCPSTPRVAIGQSVIESVAALSDAYNKVLSPLGV